MKIRRYFWIRLTTCASSEHPCFTMPSVKLGASSSTANTAYNPLCSSLCPDQAWQKHLITAADIAIHFAGCQKSRLWRTAYNKCMKSRDHAPTQHPRLSQFVQGRRGKTRIIQCFCHSFSDCRYGNDNFEGQSFAISSVLNKSLTLLHCVSRFFKRKTEVETSWNSLFSKSAMQLWNGWTITHQR